MRNTLITLAFAVLATTMVGCGHARTSVQHPGLSVETFSYSPEAATRAAADAHVRSYNAETYRIAVEQGMAFPYYGGGYGNDYWYHYRNVIPPQPVAPAPQAGTATTTAPPPAGGDYATQAELDAVRRRADDAHQRATDGLRMHQRLRTRLERDKQ